MRPRFKRTTEVFTDANGDLRLARPSLDSAYRIGRPTEEQRALLDALDGTLSLSELESRFGSQEAGDTVSQLQELGLVEDAADDDRIPPAELVRFDRQLRYFSDVGSRDLPPSLCQQRLRDAEVAVLGVGGLGGRAAWELACCGIGEMRLLDSDRVEASNLNRQILYMEEDIGRPKVEAAAERLRAFNSSVNVTATERKLESAAEIAAFIKGADVVIDAVDSPAHDIELWCNAACFEAGIPYITMSHFPPVARVGPLYVPGRTGCYVCQEIAFRREYPRFDVAMEQRRGLPSPSATLGPACGLIGGHVGLEIVHLLTGLAEPATLGVAHAYDLRTMEVTRKTVTPEPDCPVCGDLPHDHTAEPGGA